MRDLQGKRVLITGAGHGIGRALAFAFGEAGAVVIASDVDPAAVTETATSLERSRGVAEACQLDVTCSESIRAAAAKLGPIDLLVNNAGIVAGGAFLDVPVEQHLRTYEVNLLGVARVTHAFLPGLIERPEAHIVNIASASGYIGLPFGAAYGSSKWGVIGLSESIRLELEETGNRQVRVTTVCPGYVETGMFRGVKAPLLTPFLTPERLAGRVVRAVRRNRPFVRTPWTVNLGRVMGGVLPTRAFDGVARLFGVNTSMKSWRPSAQAHERARGAGPND